MNNIIFRCDKCGREFKQKIHLQNHANKKNPCDKFIHKNEETDNINNDIVINNEQMKKYLDDCKCIYCNKKLSRKSAVLYHIEHNCKKVKEIEKEKNDIFLKLKKENEELKNKLLINDERLNKLEEFINKSNFSNTTNTINNNGNSKSVNNSNNNNNNNNVTQNVYVLGYNGTDENKIISQDEFIKILNKGFFSTVHLTEASHFNINHPEYHNIYIPNMKDKYAMIYENDNWKLIHKNELIERVYEDKRNYIYDNLESFIDSLTEGKVNALKRWIDADNNGHAKIKEIKEKIELILYNNRHIPITTKNKIK